MALMFARHAHNFVKNGYFPTDEESIRRIANLLAMPEKGSVRMLDPCCGEGSALADIRHLLTAERGSAAGAEAFGIELNPERARHAKQLLDRVIQADVHDVIVKPRSMGLLFLNPPYGFGVSDQAAQRSLLADAEKAERLERTFLRKTVPYLAYGGVLVYIIPHYALDDEIRGYLVRNFEDLRVFIAPERRFRQCIVIGRRCRAAHATKAALQPLIDAQASEEGAPDGPIPGCVPATARCSSQLDSYSPRHPSIFRWKQQGGHFPVCVCDDPDPLAIDGVRRHDATPVPQGSLVQRYVRLVKVAPVATLMPA